MDEAVTAVKPDRRRAVCAELLHVQTATSLLQLVRKQQLRKQQLRHHVERVNTDVDLVVTSVQLEDIAP